MQNKLILPLSVVTESTQQTEEIGRAFACYLSEKTRQAFVAMYGDLGVGKTAFVRGFCSFFGDAVVKSPTFSIVNEYHMQRADVFHFDMYRITDEEDLYSTGFYEYFSREGYMLAEWCENIPYAIDEDAYILTIEKLSPLTPDKRRITIEESRAK